MSETPETTSKPAPSAAPSPSAPPATATAGAPAAPAAPAAATPAAPAAAPAKPPAKPAAPAPKKGEASPDAPRPSVVYAGIAGVPDIVAPIQHKVEPGETLESLAKDYYGDRKKAEKIRAANPSLVAGAALAAGTTVKIPKG